ncbi:LytTR family DNA-binding domain-containing protein [Phenylobacterium sp. LjRoot225]|uniref:LytTR family DNA-binding domain-containing protein n=1 Tax=Phenylobacterium sp. LjRoot225 TaxID=3342285 RepID=UPI003ED0123E
MTDPRLLNPWARRAADLTLLVVIGLFMGFVGAYGTDRIPSGPRFLYWTACIVGGGVVGLSLDALVAARTERFWLRIAATSLLMTLPVALWVIGVGHVLADGAVSLAAYARLLPQVLAVSAPIMAIRAVIWRPSRAVVETRTIVEPPLPEAEAVFRRRLSARRRSARLIAVEAEDHYVRVHTEAGSELVALRFADALEELARAHGHQTHRSWWVAAEAIRGGRWRRGAGELRLDGDLTVPVSRTYAGRLRAAGWL